MEIKNRNKSPRVISNKKEEYIDLELNQYILDIICRFVLSNNKNIRRTQLINLNLFINVINPENYINDSVLMERIAFIRKGVEARLVYNLTDKYMIINHINGGILDNTIIDISKFDELSNDEVDWISNMISETIKFSHIFTYVDDIMNACINFKTAEPGKRQEAVEQFERVISNVQNGLRKRKNESSSEMSFSLREDMFEPSIHETYSELTSPGRKLITGMQGMNEMLGGGFEITRCYLFFGLPGEGKSTMLLNLAYQLKKYNRGYRTKDPTKRPCIVLLTMENFVNESIERLFSIATGRDKMINYSVEDIIRMMKEDGELRLTDDNPIDIIIKFRASNSCDTSYLYSLYDDLQDDGLECICMIQDYVGRIRSTERFPDTRLEYGAITDEFKKFAELKYLALISASQLNRDASKHIDEAKQKSKSDLVRLLGRSNISESMLMLNNVDGAFMIAPEYTKEGIKYLGVQDIKHRYQTSGNLLMYLPFERNGLKLKEDFYGTPCYRTTMREETTMCVNGSNISPYHTNFPGNSSGYNPETNQNHRSSSDSIFSTVVYRQQQINSQKMNHNMQMKLVSPFVYD